MTQVQKAIRGARRRLALNRWLKYGCVSIAIAAVLFAVVLGVSRSWELSVPLSSVALGLAGVALAASLIGVLIFRDSDIDAAVRLDEAAGLRERVSTGRYCESEDDPFAAAVVADAERACTGLSVRRLIPLRTPPALGWAACSLLLVGLMFLTPVGWLKSPESAEAQEHAVEVQEAKLAVKKRLDHLRDLAEQTPALQTLKDELDGLEKPTGTPLDKPGDIRHEAIKKIDRLEDALKDQQRDPQREATRDLRKMLRQLEAPKSSGAPTRKLAQSLRQGDFKTAREEVAKLKEQLATLKSDEDRKMAGEIGKQLEELSKQLEKAAENKQLQQKLTQAGVDPEDVKRMLENLKKEDLEQLQKQLEKSGMSQQQIQQLAEQLQSQQNAGALAKKLAQAMQQGSMCQNPGQVGEAMEGLSQAGEMLSDAEMAEMEMAQMEAALAELQNARNSLGCKSCGGQGCKNCQGSGDGKGGMGQKVGQGRGGLAPEESTDVDFKTERAKVQTGKGAIIGQMLVEGEQVKGEVKSSIGRVITAAERDASDRINRDRIPRQYQKAVKEYFSTVKERTGVAGDQAGSSPPESEQTPADDPHDGHDHD